MVGSTGVENIATIPQVDVTYFKIKTTLTGSTDKQLIVKLFTKEKPSPIHLLFKLNS